MSLEAVEKRLRAMEDIEEIKHLKARYCAYCDDNYSIEGLASLFTEDAIWDGGMLGRAEGVQQIKDFFVNAQKRLPFAVHMVLNPVIEVNGDTGKGTWYLLQACTYSEGNRAVWGSGRYDEEYVKVDGQWKFKNLNLASNFWTPFDEGWVKNRFV